MKMEFAKGSQEMNMFREYYRIIQNYWIFEDTEAYWQGLIGDMDDFYKKYQTDVPLARKIGKAFVDMMLAKHEGKEAINGNPV